MVRFRSNWDNLSETKITFSLSLHDFIGKESPFCLNN